MATLKRPLFTKAEALEIKKDHQDMLRWQAHLLGLQRRKPKRKKKVT